MEEKIDAYSLLHQYIKVYPYITKSQGEYKALTRDAQIRVQQIYATIKAYQDAEKQAKGKNDKVDVKPTRKISDNKKIEAITNFFKFEPSRSFRLSESDLKEVSDKIAQLFKGTLFYDGIELDCHMLQMSSYRFGLLQMLLLTRLKSAEFCHMFDQFLPSGALTLPNKIDILLYFKHLKVADKKIEPIIVGLMGSIFKRSFTIEELVQKYDYPAETDEEQFYF